LGCDGAIQQREVAETKTKNHTAKHSNKHTATCFGSGRASGIKTELMEL
jgi:hypothetical protein